MLVFIPGSIQPVRFGSSGTVPAKISIRAVIYIHFKLNRIFGEDLPKMKYTWMRNYLDLNKRSIFTYVYQSSLAQWLALLSTHPEVERSIRARNSWTPKYIFLYRCILCLRCSPLYIRKALCRLILLNIPRRV